MMKFSWETTGNQKHLIHKDGLISTKAACNVLQISDTTFSRLKRRAGLKSVAAVAQYFSLSDIKKIDNDIIISENEVETFIEKEAQNGI